MKICFVVFGMLALFVISGCKKDKGEELPDITSVGANTFGCTIDNKAFVVREKCVYRSGPVLYRPPCVSGDISQSGKFYFKIEGESKKFIENNKVEFYIKAEMDSTATKIEKLFYARLSYSGDGGFDDYYLDTLQSNELKILNAYSNSISGIFTIHLINSSGQSKLMREGRFDIAL